MRHLLFLIILFLLPNIQSLAQEDWQYLFKQQYDRAVELFNHHYFNKEYQQALPHLEWMLNEKPGENASQYIMGIELYEKLAQAAEDPEEKYRYTQLALKLYDDRLHYFGETAAVETASVLNRKLQTAFKLLYQDSTRHEQLLTLSEAVLRQTGKQFAYYNFVPYAFLLSQMQKKGSIQEEKVKATVEELNNIAAYHRKGQGKSNYEEAMSKVNNMLSPQKP